MRQVLYKLLENKGLRVRCGLDSHIGYLFLLVCKSCISARLSLIRLVLVSLETVPIAQDARLFAVEAEC